MIVPNPIGTKLVQLFGSLLIGGLIASGVYGGTRFLPEFTSTGGLSQTTKAPMHTDLNIFIRPGSGSTTVKYPATCVASPFLKLTGTAMSGTVTGFLFTNGVNPTAASADVGFVKSCADAGGSGTQLADNTPTSSGSHAFQSSGTGRTIWNSADFLKVTFSKQTGAGYTGRVRMTLQGLFGAH